MEKGQEANSVGVCRCKKNGLVAGFEGLLDVPLDG